jgi:hypothetical protein
MNDHSNDEPKPQGLPHSAFNGLVAHAVEQQLALALVCADLIKIDHEITARQPQQFTRS